MGKEWIERLQQIIKEVEENSEDILSVEKGYITQVKADKFHQLMGYLSSIEFFKH